MIMTHESHPTRRRFLAAGAASLAATPMMISADHHETSKKSSIVRPPEGKKILLSVKLGMIPKEIEGKKLSLTERLKLAGEAGLDGVDFDQAGQHTAEEARAAVQESGVFVHNAINHDHWKMRLTSANEEERETSMKNIEHCIRVSHAAGGNGVLIVIGRASDGSMEEVEERAYEGIKALLPLAASLGQPILIENVWNQIHYDHNGGPDQSPKQFIDFVDRFQSPWVGMYYDIGNHWKYGQPAEWIRAFGHRCVKLDVKGYNRATQKWADIGEGDLPWDQVRKALDDIGFSGWATAEVGGGGLERLTTVRKQMQKVFGLL